jgi:hypothetical protein
VEDKVLDIVEGSAPSRTEIEMAGRVGADNVKAPAPNDTERKKKIPSHKMMS